MTARVYLFLPTLVATAVSGLVAWTAVRTVAPPLPTSDVSNIGSMENVVKTAHLVDAVLQNNWDEWRLSGRNRRAEELQVFRRVSLALVGTPPSLEEIREFEADDKFDRMQCWTARLFPTCASLSTLLRDWVTRL